MVRLNESFRQQGSSSTDESNKPIRGIWSVEKVVAMQRAAQEEVFADLRLSVTMLNNEGEVYSAGQVVKPGFQYIQLVHGSLTEVNSNLMAVFWRRADVIASQPQ